MDLKGDEKPEINLPLGRDFTSDKSLQSRAYQIEMFEHAMRQNIIVAVSDGDISLVIGTSLIVWQMETGSGKTQM